MHPENQGKGIATLLVESGIREALKLGLDIFLVARPAGKPVYQRAGFRVDRELIQDDTMYGGPGEWPTYFMTYESKAGSEAPS